jgi:MerR family transcriptional regulator, thiopeptide resistance regulator
MVMKKGNQPDQDGSLTTGALAKKAGVTIRTLRYYDRIGLVKPHARRPAGQRRYGALELVRLQQVLTLKFIGLSLGEIKRNLEAADFDLGAALRAQRAAIKERIRRMEAVIRAIDGALDALMEDTPDRAEHASRTGETFARIIREVKKGKMQEFYRKYYTEEQLKAISERGRNFTAADQTRVSAAWDDIYKTVGKLVEKGADPAGKEAQMLAGRAQELIDAFTGGDKGIASGLAKFYADRQNWPAEIKNMIPSPDEGTRQFYDKMMRAYRQNKSE